MRSLPLLLIVSVAYAQPSIDAARDAARDLQANPTITHTQQAAFPLAENQTDAWIRFEVTHEYDRRNHDLLAASFEWAADDYERTVYVRETLPPVFPNPPEVITHRIDETLRILEWEAVAQPSTDINGPYYNPVAGAWVFSYLAQEAAGTITIERTLATVNTSRTDELELIMPPVLYVDGYVRHAMDDGWQPIDSYVASTFDDRLFAVPQTQIDGLTVPGYNLADALPIMLPAASVALPEPSSLLYLLLGIIPCRMALARAGWRNRRQRSE